jgi:hypothetical protein
VEIQSPIHAGQKLQTYIYMFLLYEDDSCKFVLRFSVKSLDFSKDMSELGKNRHK